MISVVAVVTFDTSWQSSPVAAMDEVKSSAASYGNRGPTTRAHHADDTSASSDAQALRRIIEAAECRFRLASIGAEKPNSLIDHCSAERNVIQPSLQQTAPLMVTAFHPGMNWAGLGASPPVAAAAAASNAGVPQRLASALLDTPASASSAHAVTSRTQRAGPW